MNLSILEPEFGLGALARHLLVIGQPLGVESKLLREPLDVGGGLLVAGFELLGLLLCLDQRCLQLIDFAAQFFCRLFDCGIARRLSDGNVPLRGHNFRPGLGPALALWQ